MTVIVFTETDKSFSALIRKDRLMNGFTIGIEMLISILCGLSGALAVWYKLKGNVNIQRVEIMNLQEDSKDLKETMHKRIDLIKGTVEKNRERQDKNYQEIKSEMSAMEIRIINAIHDIKKNGE